MAFVNPGNKANCLVDKDLHGVSIEFGNEENTRTCVWYKREPVVRSVSVKAIQAVAYSFDGALLAIASHDNVIYLHDARNEYKRLGKCLGLDSVGMHIDFGVLALPQDAASASYNSDTKKVTRKFLKEGTTDVFEDRLGDLTLADLCIKVVSASYELGLWRCKAVPAIQLNGEAKEIAKDKNQLNDGWAAEEIYEPATRDAWWATVSGPLGWSMDGAWRDEEGVLTSVDRCHSWRQVSALATTDSAGMVRLYNYPCASSGATDKVYCGHAGSLARGGWSCDDAFFLTIGAIDRCIFVWRSDILDEIRERNARNDPPSTADNPSLPQSDYESALVLKAPHGGDESSAVKPWKAAAREPSNWKQTLEIGCLPDVSLELKFAYGYRGYDCRNNIGVSTIATGEVIIYHTAAIGVVYNSRAHKQVHNLEHDDDIISIAVHPSEAIVATGETGKKPKLVVWSAQTGLTIKVICFHSRGISNVCFDSAGSLLISCGLDDDRLVAVHNWRTGVLVGTGKCGKGIGVHCLSATDGGFVTGGKNHFKFWDLSIGSSGAKQVPSKSGAFHKGVDCRTVVSIACSASDTFTGINPYNSINFLYHRDFVCIYQVCQTECWRSGRIGSTHHIPKHMSGQ
jgi:WD40 repeat protein